MARAFEHRGGFLSRRFFLIALTAAAVAGAAALWSAQARVIAAAAGRFSSGQLTIERAEGTVLSGLALRGVRLRRPGFELEAREIFIRPDLRGLLSGKAVLSEIGTVAPVLVFGGAAKGGRQAGFPAWLPEVRRASIEEGRLAYGDTAVSVPDCGLSLSGGTVEIRACRALSSGASAEFSGTYSAAAASLRGRLEAPSYEMSAGFEYRFSEERHELAAAGTSYGAPFKMTGEAEGGAWKAGLSFKKTPPSGAPGPSLRRVKLRSAVLSAEGRGFSPGELAASGKFSVIRDTAASAEGVFSVKPGSSSLSGLYRYGGLAGSFKVFLAGEALSGSLRAEGGAGLRTKDGKEVSLEAADISCSLSGTVKAPGAACSGGTGRLLAGDFSADASEVSGTMAAGGKGKSRLCVSLSSPSYRGVRLDSASVSAEGSTESNVFSADAFLPGGRISLSGSSSFRKGGWHASITGFSHSGVPSLRLCSGLSAEVLGGKTRISGFCLVSGSGRMEISGIFGPPFPEELHASVSDFDLAELSRSGLIKADIGGKLDMRADYSRVSREEGGFSVSASELGLGGLPMGSVSANGTFGPGTVRLDEAEWLLYGGAVRAVGRASLREGGAEADLTVSASSMNVTPLLLLVPDVSASDLMLDGRTRVLLSGGELRNSGAIRLTAPRLGLTSLGLALSGLEASVESLDLSSVTVTASARGPKDGSVELSGPLSASGPDLAITSGRIFFDHPAGLSGTLAAGLRLGGSWKEPELSGKLELSEARFEMGKWRKFEPSREKSKYYGAMSLDLNIRAERNAWYRDGTSAVEVKGDILLKKEHYHPAAAIGTIEAVKGYYAYLGNTFMVRSGRLTFTGEVPPNPSIDIAAYEEKRGRSVKIYFNASGKALEPKVTLTSDPPMEQRDIMSFLIAGRPLRQSGQDAAAAGADAAPSGGSVAAQNLAAEYVSQQAAAALGDRLDIDVLSLKVNAENRPDITVGRYVTDDLFVTYGQVLGSGGEKRVSAEYSLTKHLSLEGSNSSDGRYVTDLLFKYGIK